MLLKSIFIVYIVVPSFLTVSKVIPVPAFITTFSNFSIFSFIASLKSNLGLTVSSSLGFCNS